MKDPAALFYISTWLTATAEMNADCRGWYLNLILHQYDKGDLPNNTESLATLANVKFSEYTQFQQVWQQVLQHKFQPNVNGRLENDVARHILQSRQQYKQKRSGAGILSALSKKMPEKCRIDGFWEFFKSQIDLTKIDASDNTQVQQVYQQVFQLYINTNKVTDKDQIKEGVQGDTSTSSVQGTDDAEVLTSVASSGKMGALGEIRQYWLTTGYPWEDGYDAAASRLVWKIREKIKAETKKNGEYRKVRDEEVFQFFKVLAESSNWHVRNNYDLNYWNDNFSKVVEGIQAPKIDNKDHRTAGGVKKGLDPEKILEAANK